MQIIVNAENYNNCPNAPIYIFFIMFSFQSATEQDSCRKGCNFNCSAISLVAGSLRKHLSRKSCKFVPQLSGFLMEGGFSVTRRNKALRGGSSTYGGSFSIISKINIPNAQISTLASNFCFFNCSGAIQ